jgi:hypothetical protein
MNYSPMEPMVHEDKPTKPNERQRRRIARAIGVTAVTSVALLVGFGAWSQLSRSGDAVAVLEARKNAVPNVRTTIGRKTWDLAPSSCRAIWRLSTARHFLPAPQAISMSTMSILAARCAKGMCWR